MRTAFRSFLLFAAIAALVAAGGLSASAQKEKDKDKKAADIGTIEVYKGKDGWRFKIVNAEGKGIAGGYVGHEKKEDALKEVEFLKATLAKGKVEVKDEKKDK